VKSRRAAKKRVVAVYIRPEHRHGEQSERTVAVYIRTAQSRGAAKEGLHVEELDTGLHGEQINRQHRVAVYRGLSDINRKQRLTAAYKRSGQQTLASHSEQLKSITV
jgi:hypothetical protein